MEGKSDKQDSEGKSEQSAKQSLPERKIIQSAEPSERENATHPTGNKPKKGCWRDIRWRSPHIIVNAGILVVAFGAATIYYCQLKEMQKSGEFLVRSYQLQTQSLRIDQRAWVAPTGFSGKAELGKPFIVTISVKNTGKTFAEHFVGTSTWITKDLSDPDPDFDSALNESHVVRSVALLAPGAEFIQQIKVPTDGRKLTSEDIETASDPTKVFYCFGGGIVGLTQG